MYYSTGFSRDEIADLCALILKAVAETGDAPWPPGLGLYKSVVATLCYLRRNRVQAEIAESLGVSQPTISRAISAITPLLQKALEGSVPTADEFGRQSQFIIDGTLLPVLVLGLSPGTVLGKAQDHRTERAGRVHSRRRHRVDFRSGRRKPP
jgi:DNA-binding transcriptional ArsR family regulator